MENIRIYAKMIKACDNCILSAALKTLEGYFRLPYTPEEEGKYWFHNNSNVRGYVVTDCKQEEADYRLYSKSGSIYFKRTY